MVLPDPATVALLLSNTKKIHACSGLRACAPPGRLIPGGTSSAQSPRQEGVCMYKLLSGVVRIGEWSKKRPEGRQGQIVRTSHSSKESGFYSKNNAKCPWRVFSPRVR